MASPFDFTDRPEPPVKRPIHPIVCPRCAASFVPVRGYSSASCPRCGNITAVVESADLFSFEDNPNRVEPTVRTFVTKTRPGQGMGIAAVSLGVVGFCFALMSFGLVFFAVLALPCAILAIVFGIIGLGSEGHGMALAGLILGGLSLAIPLLALVAVFTASELTMPPRR